MYLLGDYQRVEHGASVGELGRYVRIFWLDGFWPMVFGSGCRPFEHEAWHVFVIVATQVVLLGLDRLEHRAPPRRVARAGPSCWW